MHNEHAIAIGRLSLQAIWIVPISTCAQSVINALGIQSSYTDANFVASTFIHGF